MWAVMTLGVWLSLDAWQYGVWQFARWAVVALWRSEYGRMAPW